MIDSINLESLAAMTRTEDKFAEIFFNEVDFKSCHPNEQRKITEAIGHTFDVNYYACIISIRAMLADLAAKLPGINKSTGLDIKVLFSRAESTTHRSGRPSLDAPFRITYSFISEKMKCNFPTCDPFAEIEKAVSEWEGIKDAYGSDTPENAIPADANAE